MIFVNIFEQSEQKSFYPPFLTQTKNKSSPEPNECLYVLSKMSHVAEEKAKLVIADQSMKCIKVIVE